MKMIIQEPVRDGDAFVIRVQVVFPSLEYSADEAKAFMAEIEAEATKLDRARGDGQAAAMRIDPIQARVNKMMGVSDALFARYNPAPR